MEPFDYTHASYLSAATRTEYALFLAQKPSADSLRAYASLLRSDPHALFLYGEADENERLSGIVRDEIALQGQYDAIFVIGSLRKTWRALMRS